MRIKCPYCGERGVEEFTCKGDASVKRPGKDESDTAWHDYVYLRRNVAGISGEYWHHTFGCRSWLVVTRDTRTHQILSVAPAAEERR